MPKSKQCSSWTLRNGEVFNIAPFGVMGIVNLAPDSFYDQGLYSTAEAGLDHAKTLWAEGAHILDIGAESTRPGASPVSAEDEMKRLLPVLNPLMAEINTANEKAKKGQGAKAPYVSVDTYHASTAKAALEAGVHIINDISACTFEPELLEVVGEYKPGYVLMHTTNRPHLMQQTIIHDNITDNIRLFFEFHLQRLTKAGLPEANIVLDLGIGFGKTFEQNVELLQNLTRFQQIGLPILTAISMKSFLSPLSQCDANDFVKRGNATQALTAVLATKGFCLHRVHRVADTVQTLRTIENF